MATLRPLDPPHKGIRNALSQLSLAAGSTAAPDTAAVGALVTLCIDVLDFLDEHADFEEKYILEPLEERVPGAQKPRQLGKRVVGERMGRTVDDEEAAGGAASSVIGDGAGRGLPTARRVCQAPCPTTAASTSPPTMANQTCNEFIGPRIPGHGRDCVSPISWCLSQ